MNLYRIAYISGESSRFSPMELQELLVSSRRNNDEKAITGILLYKHGNFMQVIEGPREAVEDLFGRISADDRHRRVISFISEPIEKRDFSDWAMSFRDLDTDDDPAVAGFHRFLDDPWSALEIGGYSDGVRRSLAIFVKSTN